MFFQVLSTSQRVYEPGLYTWPSITWPLRGENTQVQGRVTTADHWKKVLIRSGKLLTKNKSNYKNSNIQWGSEIWTSLDFKWSKRGWVANGLDFKWDLKSGSSAIWSLDKWAPFCQKPFEIWAKMSGFRMVGTIAKTKTRPFENRTIWNWTFKKSRFQMLPDFKWLNFRSSLYLKFDF